MGKKKPHNQDNEESSIKETERAKHGALIATVAGVCAAIALLAFTLPSAVPGMREADDGEPSPSSSRTAAPSASASVSASPSRKASAAASTEVPAQAEPTWQHVDFSNSVFIGSSTTDALFIYGLPEGANYISGTGKTVETVMTDPIAGGHVAAIDELAGKNYNQVFLAFGLNELGWPNDEIFLQMYAQVIARVREYLPTAAIYIESVLPVGLERSQRNRFGVNQDRINAFNAMLAQFAADQGVHFLDVSTELKGPDGYLPAEASQDGVHLTREWCERWVELIAQHTEDVLNAGTGATRPLQEQPPPAAPQEEQAAPVAAADPAAVSADPAAPDPAVPPQAAAVPAEAAPGNEEAAPAPDPAAADASG